MMVHPRFALVQECVVDLWESRDDGRGHWVTLERTLIDMLAPKKKKSGKPAAPVSVVADGSPYPANVIVLKDRLRARAARRRGER